MALLSFVLLYYSADASIMAKFDAHKITDTSSWIYKLVEDIAKKARLESTPEVYLVPVKAPNSFIVGRNSKRAQLGLTEGLLETLTKRELEGVVGHEMAHIRDCDAKLGGIVTGLISALWNLAPEGRRRSGYHSAQSRETDSKWQNGFFRSVLSILTTPLAAAFVQLLIPRNREFLADRRGATFTNRFSELASALRKIQSSTERIASDNHPHLAHLLIYSSFHRPLYSALFGSHPPVAERVAQLEKLALTGGGVEGVY